MTTIRVLWRRPDTLTLYGIPYSMRPGQSPRDLYEGRRSADTIARAQGYHGATMRSPGPLDGWIYLGEPGWYGNRTEAQRREIDRFLSCLSRDEIPSGPSEWIDLGRDVVINLE